MNSDEMRDRLDLLLREIAELRANQHDPAINARLAELADEAAGLEGSAGERSSAWERVQLARHQQRPHTLDYVGRLFTGFVEIHGDRRFADDPAIVTGLGRFGDREVMVIGQQKGRDTKQKLFRNFGMPKPEGYRKALRAMQLAAKFRRPILTFLDTPGAYPGLDAEERGQAEAIAYNLREMARLGTPILVTCIGEGGSGGALALGVGNVVLMLENAIYSVISPESCAAIVWRDAGRAALAAEALKLTAQDLVRLGLVDEIVPEPPGGAHSDHDQAARLLGDALRRELDRLCGMPAAELVSQRHTRFRQMGNFFV